jgi:hypothetical protein
MSRCIEGLIIGAVNIKYPFNTFMNNWKETYKIKEKGLA